MKAIVYREYGTTDNLHLEEVPKPVPKPNEVLIKMEAASVNSWDWDMLRGKPFIVRMGALFKPRFNILGIDVAGRVEAIGSQVKKFKPGDEVFGDVSGYSWGGFAEYVCAPEKPLALKSPKMTFEEAAALPHAGVLALQGLRLHPGIQAGHQVLLNGAGGGVGTIALQLVKQEGAEVTVVDRADKFDMLRALGADHFIDYTKEDFTGSGKQYDLILDVVAHRSFFDYKRALARDGVFVLIGGRISLLLPLLTLGPLFAKLERKKLGILPHKPNSKDLAYLRDCFEAGELKPIIDKQFPLSEVPAALQYLGDGNARGKVVITI